MSFSVFSTNSLAFVLDVSHEDGVTGSSNLSFPDDKDIHQVTGRL